MTPLRLALVLAIAAFAGCKSAESSTNPESIAACKKLIPIGERLGLEIDYSAKAMGGCAATMDEMKRDHGQKAFEDFVACLDTVELEVDLVTCHPAHEPSMDPTKHLEKFRERVESDLGLP